MIRKIIVIDEEKCNGCGLCASACHEGAIGMVNGKAKLLREDYCDGLGDCLPACPTGAITFTEREAAPYDAAAVQAAKSAAHGHAHAAGGCPSSAARTLHPATHEDGARQESQLGNWPVQIKLLPLRAPYLEGADLLIAADCTAFAYANLHADFLRGHVTLVGCPKLDGVDYAEKLAQIFLQNDIRSITVLRMEVPCCGGLTAAVQRALEAAGRDIPLAVRVVGIDGTLR